MKRGQVPVPYKPQQRKCRVCGCTDADCSGCIERTGKPCHWVASDLCSACTLEAFGGARENSNVRVCQSLEPGLIEFAFTAIMTPEHALLIAEKIQTLAADIKGRRSKGKR